MNWPTYPAYTNSGVAWLGGVPSGWAVLPLKYAATVFPSNVDKHSNDGETPVQLCNYTDVYYNDSIHGGLDFMRATATSGEIRKFTLRQGDTLITKDSETADDIGQSSYVVESLPGVLCGYHLSVVRPSATLIGRFAKRLFDSLYIKAVMEVSATGLTRVGLGQYAIDNLDIPLPPVAEQVQIADFLDRETAKIDALIVKQEQLIATLREDRTATITHAVTKGLDPDVEMKDSGVEWLGDIPLHWAHLPVKFVCTTLSGYPFKSEGFSQNSNDVKLLRGANVGVDQIDWTDAVYWPCSEAPALVDYALKQGDIVMGLDRPFISGGIRVSRIGPADVPSLLLQRVLRLRAAPEFDQDYLFHLLTGPGIVHHLTPMFTGVSVPHVSPDQVGALPVPLPPLTEQRRIAKFLDERCGRIDALINKATEVIDTLREYRSALITDAVTGKIDVRGAA